MIKDRVYPYRVVIILDTKLLHNTFLRINVDDTRDSTRDSTGYSPGYYINDNVMDWCYENFGPGGNGTLEDSLFYQGRGDYNDRTWWIQWSYNPDYKGHYITAHFEKEEDAIAFKLRWL